MIAPQYGDRVRVNALVGGIYVPQEGIWLKVPGDETEVVWSPFWQGELDLQRICLPVPPPTELLPAVAPEDREPEPEPEPEPSEVKPKKRKSAEPVEEAPMAEEAEDDED
jgi:outer membrane biosynthesis protein TonB